ncbi:DUF4389 domain-containing protein [Actinoplanes sp. NPDC049265]|uniref:DUF4389 domain-containing protein n=1 Tax=Actinoplanes sp. NPDC049265 TaxID=3363902 RepID=UPI00372361ED
MRGYPLRVEARRDESPSRWLWLVKWFLLIPHYVVLLVLYLGLVVLTLVAYLAVLFTGRYPPAIAAYNLGVLRWSWRVGYYGYQALGTDRYPPFTMADVPEHPARVSLTEAPHPPRWLPLVAWLFAVPHLLLLGALSGAVTWSGGNGGDRTTTPLSVISAAVIVAGVALLFTGRLPGGLHDLLVGVTRWNLRVVSYLTLLTPRYPPFRLDQGGSEPVDDPVPPAPPEPAAPAAAPVHRGGVVGPVLGLIAGVLLLVPGAGLAIGGGALLALNDARDAAGYVTSPAVSVRTSTAAVTAESITLQAGDVFTRGFADIGGFRVTATGPAGDELFVGIASSSDVDAWLRGTAHDELIGMSSGDARYDRAPGARRAAPSPAAQSFWLASGTGTGDATLTWEATSGTYAVVVANADGSTGVTADVRAATQVPGLAGPGTGLLITGILLDVLAILLIVLGAMGLGRRHSGTLPPPAAPSGPPVTGPPPLVTTTR